MMLRLLGIIADEGTAAWKVSFNQLMKRSVLPPKDKVRADAGINRWYYLLLKGLSDDELKAVKQQLTVQPQNQIYGGDGAAGFPIYKTVKNKDNQDVLVVPRYYGIAKWGWPAKTHFNTDKSRMNDGIEFEGTLRPLQVEATDIVLECVRDCGGAVLVKDCGMGKTVDGSYVALQLGYRTAVLVHNEDLAEQWKERILSFFPKARVGIVQKDRLEYQDMDYVLFMVQSLYKRTQPEAYEKGRGYPAEMFDSFGTLIVDEAHHIGAKMFCNAITKFSPLYTLAMTATPTRKDRQAHLISWFMGPLAFKKENSNKHVNVVVHKYDMPRKEIVYKKRGPTGKPLVAKSLMVHNLFKDPQRNASIVKRLLLRMDEGRKILVLCTYHVGLNVIYELLKEARPEADARFYTGKVSKKERPQALEAQVIFATTPKGDEALDCPALDTLFRIDPVSESKQPVGRILRDCPGKQGPVVEHWWDPFSIFDGMYWKCYKYYKSHYWPVQICDVLNPDTNSFHQYLQSTSQQSTANSSDDPPQ